MPTPPRGKREVTVNDRPLREHESLTIERRMTGVTRIQLNGYDLPLGTVVKIDGNIVAYNRIAEHLQKPEE